MENNRLSIIDSVIGESLIKAREIAGWAGYRLRVTSEDGNVFIGTMDYRLDRINVTIKEGIVVSAKLG